MKMKTTTAAAKWVNEYDWNYFITLRRNYKTTSTMVNKISNELFDKVKEIDRMIYIGERDSLDWHNHHIHILIKTNDINKVKKQLGRTNKLGTNLIEEVLDNMAVSNYITKYIDKDLEWDFLIK
jgi:hypothetical protein